MKMDMYAKSIVAAVIAGLGALQTAQLDNVVTSAEWTSVIGATIGALALVWGISNAPPKE